MTRYTITHVTTYQYTEPVSLCQNVARLSARACDRQRFEPSVLSISPDPAVIEERIDYFGNPTHYFTIQEPHRQLTVEATHDIAVFQPPTVGPAATATWEEITPAWFDAYPFAFDSRYAAAHPQYAEYAAPSFSPGRPILEAALDLTARVYKGFTYDPKATNVATPVAEMFEKRRGVCQDFAHLLLACFRSLGLAARYVSGYLSTLPPPGRPRLVGADATHAWVSLFCGAAGWIDLDPTNNQIPEERHILLAWGRDYDDVSPLKGVILGGGQHVVKVSVDVRAEQA
jgi:transglutaminase-like putative cysteine protease